MKIDMAFVEELQGYKRGTPPPGLINGAGIDARICCESKCSNCGHQGMEFHPFIKDEPHSYRAFAVCPECGEAFEF